MADGWNMLKGNSDFVFRFWFLFMCRLSASCAVVCIHSLCLMLFGIWEIGWILLNAGFNFWCYASWAKWNNFSRWLQIIKISEEVHLMNVHWDAFFNHIIISQTANYSDAVIKIGKETNLMASFLSGPSRSFTTHHMLSKHSLWYSFYFSTFLPLHPPHSSHLFFWCKVTISAWGI